MIAVPTSPDEAKRLAALRNLEILDTPPDSEFDALVQVTSLVCGTPISLISLIDENRQWFKANFGLPGVPETPRELAFCNYTILQDGIFEVPDATIDSRFANNPLVTGDPGIRFYAGVPLRLSDGSLAGSLCVIDRQPRRLDARQRALLDSLAQVAACALESWAARRRQAEMMRAIQASEERERHAYEATPAMLHTINEQGMVIAVSDAWLAKLGYARDEVLGRPSFDFLAPQSRDYVVNDIVPDLLATGCCSDIDVQLVRKDGEIIDALASATWERDAAGRLRRGMIVLEDVTQRRRAERALNHERQRLADVVAATDAGTWEWNVQTDELLVNARYAEILGWPLQAGTKLTIARATSLIHPDDREDSQERLHQLIGGGIEYHECERRMRHRDGHYVWVLSRAKVMVRTADGRAEWMFGALQDITQRKRQEIALRTSEEFLERTGRVAGVGGWELDVATQELTWSAETRRLHGVPADYVPNLRDAVAFYAPEARPVIQQAVDRSMVDGSGWDLELPFVRADGRAIWVRAVGTAVHVDGRISRLTGAFQDVTERVVQHLAVEEANARIALATEGARIGIWEWDFRTDIVHWDACTWRLFGKKPFAGPSSYETWRDLVHPDDRADAEVAVKDGLEGVRPYDTEFRVVWDDGSTHHIRAIARVHAAVDGRGKKLVGVNWDVTEARLLAAERDQQAERLAESEASLRLITENANDMISRVGADGRRLYVSPAAANIFGVAPETLIERNPVALIHPEDAPAVADWQAALLAGQPRVASTTFRVLNPQRGEVWVEAAARTVRGTSSSPAGYISVLRDVTDRVLLEREREERARELGVANTGLDRLARHLNRARDVAEQANRAKTRFLAGMSHELRTPLNGVLGYAQLLRIDGGLSERQAERVQSMLTAGNHLLEMIHCVLDLSEIETGGEEVQTADVDLRTLANAALDMVRPAAEAKRLELTSIVAADVPGRIVTDPKRLRQVLLNLLGNAVKFTARGQVTLKMHARADGTRLRFEVVDTGPGIPADKSNRLFRAFERLDSAAEVDVEGAGLGLSLAAKLVGTMGGTLGHRDNAGGGSIFGGEIPLVRSDAPAEQAQAVCEPMNSTRDGSASANDATLPILVVDDVDMNRDIAAAFIEAAGYDAICVESGAEAVAIAASTDLLAVLMDVRMPGMDGLEASFRIRAHPGPRGQVPIVAVTAQAFTGEIETCRGVGMDLHLAKPFTFEALLDAVRQATRIGAMRSCSRPAAHLPEPPDCEAGMVAEADHPGASLPIVDTDALERTAAVLKPDAVRTYLHSLVDRAEALRHSLAPANALADRASVMADAAHAMAGSAGMFGFQRLVFVAKQFEQAVRADPAQAAGLAPGFRAVLDASLVPMRDRAEAGIPAVSKRELVG